MIPANNPFKAEIEARGLDLARDTLIYMTDMCKMRGLPMETIIYSLCAAISHSTEAMAKIAPSKEESRLVLGVAAFSLRKMADSFDKSTREFYS